MSLESEHDGREIGCPPNASGGAGSPTSGSAIAAHPDLLADRWEKRYLADEARAAEALELYATLGYEVLASPLEPGDFGPICGGCPLVVSCPHVVIYTRRAG